MKKNILVCGLISGIIVATFMVSVSMACYKNDDFESSMVLGYASMILAFSLVFVGIKNYRDKFNNGVVSFGKAFKIGLYITLIASTIYVVVWLVEYYLFIPDFMDKYTAHVLKEASREGASQAVLNEKSAEMRSYKEMYQSPIMVILLTYSEILPIGLVVSLISALILKRKPNLGAAA